MRCYTTLRNIRVFKNRPIQRVSWADLHVRPSRSRELLKDISYYRFVQSRKRHSRQPCKWWPTVHVGSERKWRRVRITISVQRVSRWRRVGVLETGYTGLILVEHATEVDGTYRNVLLLRQMLLVVRHISAELSAATARRYASAVYATALCLSVCLFVTSGRSVKTDMHIVT